LLNPQPLTARIAHEWGVVAEVVPVVRHLIKEVGWTLARRCICGGSCQINANAELNGSLRTPAGEEGQFSKEVTLGLDQTLPRGGKAQMNSTDVSSTQLPKAKLHEKADVEEYDLVFLGSGAGSKVAAWTFAAQGQRVAVIESKYIGGACPNIACLPSKNIVHSAKVASYLRRSEEFGLSAKGFAVDMSVVRERKRRMVSDLIDLHLEEYKKSGAELILGTARFIGPRTVEATLPDGTSRRLRGTNVVIGTGTRATLEPISGLAEAQPLTHVEALELDELPEHLLVIGGGYVGLELSQTMRRFGSKVSVIDRNSRLMHREDEDVSEALGSLFVDEGISVVLNAHIKQVSGKSGQAVKVVFEQNGVEKKLEGSHLLVTAGRTPNTQGLGVELAGVELTEDGYVKVNERRETTAPGVWAVGDVVAGSPKFTHISIDDFRVFRDNLMGGDHTTTAGRQVPFCLFTDPEFARVGLSEKEAKAHGVGYRLFKIPMEAVLRTRTLSETRGFLKALVELENDRILGFSAFGVSAGEIMSAAQIGMIARMPYSTLREAILAHPTIVEGFNPLFSSVPTVRNA
jgi:pyruvate/2-oxoglutarate dehydrogenase complex dihydrolipoamide dehydrogenase (E3) component